MHRAVLSLTILLIGSLWLSCTGKSPVSVSAGSIEHGTRAADSAVVPVGGVLPTTFTLGQNYPDPFNPTTAIDFTVPTPAHVKISVADASGREIAVLIDHRLQPGRYVVEFDGSNLATGSYTCTMTAGDFSTSRKMSLVK